MAIPAGAVHVIFGGAMPGGERWESGFWTSGATITSQSLADAYAQLWSFQLLAADSSGALRLYLTTYCDPATTIQYVKAYCYPTGGPSATYIGSYTPTTPTTTVSRTLPNQSALVVSLRTDRAGRRYRGRMFLPIATLTVQGTGQLTTALAQTIADNWKLCFNDWNAVSGNGIVSVVSSAAGAATKVSKLIIDTRLDVQRGRAAKQLPSGIATSVVT